LGKSGLSISLVAACRAASIRGFWIITRNYLLERRVTFFVRKSQSKVVFCRLFSH